MIAQPGHLTTVRKAGQRGSVLILVIWIAFGLVSLALYFAHSMSFEMRAADNRVAGIEADEAIHCIVDVMSAGAPYTAIRRAVHIHPTVSELIPTLLGELSPLS